MRLAPYDQLDVGGVTSVQVPVALLYAHDGLGGVPAIHDPATMRPAAHDGVGGVTWDQSGGTVTTTGAGVPKNSSSISWAGSYIERQ